MLCQHYQLWKYLEKHRRNFRLFRIVKYHYNSIHKSLTVPHGLRLAGNDLSWSWLGCLMNIMTDIKQLEMFNFIFQTFSDSAKYLNDWEERGNKVEMENTLWVQIYKRNIFENRILYESGAPLPSEYLKHLKNSFKPQGTSCNNMTRRFWKVDVFFLFHTNSNFNFMTWHIYEIIHNY